MGKSTLRLTSILSTSTQVGSPYSQTNTASRGTTPYAYSISKGAIPAGCVLDTLGGTVGGVPTTAGAFSYTVKATDAKGFSATKAITGTIYAAAPAPAPPPPPPSPPPPAPPPPPPPPSITLSNLPANPTTSTTASISFTLTGTATVYCRRDGFTPALAPNPFILGATTPLAVGSHQVDYYLDTGGGIDPNVPAASYSWSVVAPAPAPAPPPAPPSFSTPPVVNGMPMPGAATSYTQGNATGGSALAVTQQWRLDGSAIGGAINAAYTPLSTDAGHALSVTETVTDTLGQSTSATSAAVTVTTPSPPPPPPVPPSFTAAPSINGSPSVGVAVSVTPGMVTGTAPITSTYQWYVAGVLIIGATGTSYTPSSSDGAKALTVTQTATSAYGSASATSAAKTVATTALPVLQCVNAMEAQAYGQGISVWTGNTISGSDSIARLKVVPNIVPGQQGYERRIILGDPITSGSGNRSENSEFELQYMVDGHDYWGAVAVKPLTGEWPTGPESGTSDQILHQIHQRVGTSPGPTWGLYFGGRNNNIYTARVWGPSPVGNQETITSLLNGGGAALPIGVWTRFKWHIRFGSDASFLPVIELWRNGVLILQRNPTTGNNLIGQVGDTHYIKVGLYKWSFSASDYGIVTHRAVQYSEVFWGEGTDLSSNADISLAPFV